MQRSHPSASLAIILLLLASLATGCSSVRTFMGAPPAVAAEPLTPVERTFVTQATHRITYDLEVSRLAVERATSPRVRTFAQTLAAHRAQAATELTGMMSAKGVSRPAALPADKATRLRRLSALRPSPDFDLGYVRVVGVEDQAATIALFERARRDARSSELRDWIDRTLPVLRSDLATARSLAGQLAG